jgi:hypothetical protein
MPDVRSHRGAHPEDARDFRPEVEPTLRRAVEELSYLLTREYGETAALKLVGDRYQLTTRQRSAVLRGACSDAGLAARRARRVEGAALAGAQVAVDGFNCLITVEAMLSGAPLFIGRDGALRDLASVHGSYRRVQETERALGLVASELATLSVRHVTVQLDRPVGNSGRVRALYASCLDTHGIAHDVRLSDHVDRELIELALPVVSSDGYILERAPWFDLAGRLAAVHGASSPCLRLADASEKSSSNGPST